MVINEEHNFIFVHVFRTGGSSMDNALPGTKLLEDTHKKLEAVPNWENYFSFGVVRNPWDRIVSAYHFSIKTKQFIGTFDDYVQRFAHGDLRTRKQYAQHDMIKNCNYVIRFEHLQEDLNDVCNHLNMLPVQLLHIWKTDHSPYTEMYNDEQKQIIADASSGDIEEYGFTFGSTATKRFGVVR